MAINDKASLFEDNLLLFDRYKPGQLAPLDIPAQGIFTNNYDTIKYKSITFIVSYDDLNIGGFPILTFQPQESSDGVSDWQIINDDKIITIQPLTVQGLYSPGDTMLDFGIISNKRYIRIYITITTPTQVSLAIIARSKLKIG